MQWRFTWERDWDRIWQGEVFEAWERAYRHDTMARRTPFSHPTVLKAWVDAHPANAFDPFFMIAEHDDGRRAFHLFVRPRGPHALSPAKVMQSAGGDFFDYTEPVVFPGEDGNTALEEAFWTALERDLSERGGAWFDLFEMPRVREQTLDASHAPETTEVALSVRLDAYAGFDDYVAHRSKKLRSHFRRTAKRLSDLGEVTYEVYDACEIEQVRSWISDLAREKERKYDVAGSGSIFATYLDRLAQYGMPSGLVRCSTLSLDGRPVSWSLDFVLDKTFFAYATSFDPNFADFGVGHLHALRHVEAAFEEGLEVFDLLWGDERYKSRWTDGDVTRLCPVQISSTRAASMARRLTYGGLRLLGKVKKYAAPEQGYRRLYPGSAKG